MCRNGVVVRDGLIFEFPAAVVLTLWGCVLVARHGKRIFSTYVTRGLWLVVVLFGCFLALFVPFSVIGDDGDMDANLPIFVANFVVFWNALLRCSMSRPDGALFKEIGALA